MDTAAEESISRYADPLPEFDSTAPLARGGDEGVSTKPQCVARCPRCGNRMGQWRGYRQRRDGRVAHRRVCSECGKWYFIMVWR